MLYRGTFGAVNLALSASLKEPAASGDDESDGGVRIKSPRIEHGLAHPYQNLDSELGRLASECGVRLRISIASDSSEMSLPRAIGRRSSGRRSAGHRETSPHSCRFAGRFRV